MKKYLKISSFTSSIVLISAGLFKVASQPAVSSVPNPFICGDKIADCIKNIGGFITPLAILGFFACVVYAGFVRLTAAGNSEQEAKSIKIATSAAIGFAIIALAPLIIRLVMVIIGLDPSFFF